MYRISSDFLYNDNDYRQLLAVADKGDDNGYKMKMIKYAVNSCIENGLTQKQKKYILMYYFDSLTMPEIAHRLGVNKSSVSRGISGAKERIRRQLEFVVMQ